MRIAFDLDGTLVPMDGGSETVPYRSLRPLFRERLREGATQLLRQLVEQGHDVWIYTTSVRTPIYICWWFRLLGIRLGGVINGSRHATELRTRGSELQGVSKYPPAFGIDLLVDDLPGVALEGRRHGFEVLLVDPDDTAWVGRVVSALDQWRQSRRGPQG